MRHFLRSVIVTAVAAGAVVVGAGTASAEIIGDESAICDTTSIIQTGKNAKLKSRPSPKGDTVAVSHQGARFTCSSVEGGVEHDYCGSEASPSWIVIEFVDDQDITVRLYAASSCFADVYAS